VRAGGRVIRLERRVLLNDVVDDVGVDVLRPGALEGGIDGVGFSLLFEGDAGSAARRSIESSGGRGGKERTFVNNSPGLMMQKSRKKSTFPCHPSPPSLAAFVRVMTSASLLSSSTSYCCDARCKQPSTTEWKTGANEPRDSPTTLRPSTPAASRRELAESPCVSGERRCRAGC
jgi:hypothetical protein